MPTGSRVRRSMRGYTPEEQQFLIEAHNACAAAFGLRGHGAKLVARPRVGYSDSAEVKRSLWSGDRVMKISTTPSARRNTPSDRSTLTTLVTTSHLRLIYESLTDREVGGLLSTMSRSFGEQHTPADLAGATLVGPARPLLSDERLILNAFQRLEGIYPDSNRVRHVQRTFAEDMNGGPGPSSLDQMFHTYALRSFDLHLSPRAQAVSDWLQTELLPGISMGSADEQRAIRFHGFRALTAWMNGQELGDHEAVIDLFAAHAELQDVGKLLADMSPDDSLPPRPERDM